MKFVCYQVLYTRTQSSWTAVPTPEPGLVVEDRSRPDFGLLMNWKTRQRAWTRSVVGRASLPDSGTCHHSRALEARVTHGERRRGVLT
jgi:hypothetical protein